MNQIDLFDEAVEASLALKAAKDAGRTSAMIIRSLELAAIAGERRWWCTLGLDFKQAAIDAVLKDAPNAEPANYNGLLYAAFVVAWADDVILGAESMNGVAEPLPILMSMSPLFWERLHGELYVAEMMWTFSNDQDFPHANLLAFLDARQGE